MSCPTGKMRYRAEIDALISLSRTQSKAAYQKNPQQASKREEIRAYRCRRCKGWHLTSEPKRVES